MAFNLKVLEASKTIQELVRQLNDWRTVLNSVGFPALSRGVVVEATIGATPSQVSHGLRAKPRGWVLLRNQVASTAASVSEVSSDETTLTMVASGQTTVTLWVYV